MSVTLALNLTKQFARFNNELAILSLRYLDAFIRSLPFWYVGDIFLDISRRNKNPFLSSPFPSQENKRNKNYAFEDGASGNERRVKWTFSFPQLPSQPSTNAFRLQLGHKPIKFSYRLSVVREIKQGRMEKFLIGKFSAIISYRMPLSGDFERTIRNMRLRESGIDWKKVSEEVWLKEINVIFFLIFKFPLKNCLNPGLDAFFRKSLCQHKNWFFQKLANQCWTVDLIEAFLESLIHVLCSNQIFYDYGLFMELAMKFYLRNCLRISHPFFSLTCSLLPSTMADR